MTLVRRFILIVVGILAIFGINYIYNPSIDDTEEYWDIQEEISKAETKTHKMQERIEKKKNKHNENKDKSLIDKIKDEWDKE